jgi:hypothetical protein
MKKNSDDVIPIATRDLLFVCFQGDNMDASPACGISMTGAFFINPLD